MRKHSNSIGAKKSERIKVEEKSHSADIDKLNCFDYDYQNIYPKILIQNVDTTTTTTTTDESNYDNENIKQIEREKEDEEEIIVVMNESDKAINNENNNSNKEKKKPLCLLKSIVNSNSSTKCKNTNKNSKEKLENKNSVITLNNLNSKSSSSGSGSSGNDSSISSINTQNTINVLSPNTNDVNHNNHNCSNTTTTTTTDSTNNMKIIKSKNSIKQSNTSNNKNNNDKLGITNNEKGNNNVSCNNDNDCNNKIDNQTLLSVDIDNTKQVKRKPSKLRICSNSSFTQNLKLHNPFNKLKKSLSINKQKLHMSKSTQNIIMTPLNPVANKSEKVEKNKSKDKKLFKNLNKKNGILNDNSNNNNIYKENQNQSTMPNCLHVKNLSVNSRLSMNSSPGGYFSDNSSTRSGVSNSTAISNLTFLSNYKSEEKLKRKDFSEYIRTLGSGATGNIHLVYKKDDKDKYYAIKEFIMPNQKGNQKSDREFFKHLQAEYTIGTLLHHKNVVEMEHFIYSDYYKRNIKQRHVYQVMEYCNGGDLFDIIQRGCLSQGDILCFFRQLMEGLNYIHSMGVAHRDLKPENILFKGNRDLKILDFGAAIMFKSPYSDEIIQCSGIVGSEPYMAPEQFSLKKYDPRTLDIWSCAIIFLAMFYNELPWKRAIQSNQKFNYWCTRGKSELVNDLPNGPRQLITRMLEPDPEKRITMKEIFEDPWFKSIHTCAIYENDDLLCHNNSNHSNISNISNTTNNTLTANYSSFMDSSSVFHRNSSRLSQSSYYHQQLNLHTKPSNNTKSNSSNSNSITIDNSSSQSNSNNSCNSNSQKNDHSHSHENIKDDTSVNKSNDTNIVEEVEANTESNKNITTTPTTTTKSTKLTPPSSSTVNNNDNTKKAKFIISSDDEEEDDEDEYENENENGKSKEKEIEKKNEEDEKKKKEDVPNYWGLDLKCTHDYSFELSPIDR